MKHSGLMFTSLALCCSLANAASDSTLSGDTLHIPHVMYGGMMYDVKMKFQAPDRLLLQTATPITSMPMNPAVMVSKDLKFSLSEIAVSNKLYKANVTAISDTEFQATGITETMPMGTVKSFTDLGVLEGGKDSYAYAVSEDGTVIAGKVRDADRKSFPAIFDYTQGNIETLVDLGGGRPRPTAVNNSGAIAGYGTLKTEDGAPRIYNAFYNKSGAELVNLGTLGGTDSRALGMNNKDMLVGWSASKADNSDHVAFMTDASSGTPVLKPLEGEILGGKRSFAFDINDNNQIAGVATKADGSAIAFVYKDGVTTELGSLDDSGYSEARAINDKGETTGWSLTTNGKYAAFMHDGTTMTELPGLGGDTQAYDINTHGHIVGSARDEEDNRHAFVYKDGHLMDLYKMIPAADQENWKELREAYSISDDGVVVGRGRFWTDKAEDKSASRAYRIQL